MPRLYACIISPHANSLAAVARDFSYAIEMLDDGVLFDVSGLERLIGKPERVAAKIVAKLKQHSISGSVAVAETADAAMLLARQDGGLSHTVHAPEVFSQIPLTDLGLENDTLNVFTDLGMRTVDDLLAVPRDDLVGRYGRDFEAVIKRIEQKGSRLITPNIKEDRVAWSFELDQAVEDFEQMIFIINHGLDDLFARVAHYAKSTEQLDISFRLANRTVRNYEIKTSFPTLDRAFWLRLINLRVSLNAPEAAIFAVKVTAHFTKPRPVQKGLYAASRPEPESLLLTVNKLKKLVGEDNVGVPTLLDQRLARPFKIDTDKLPSGKESVPKQPRTASIAFTWFRPPLRAEVLVRDRRLMFIKTRNFSARVLEYSGVWRANSKWWETPWKTQEWDVEVENNGVYRLSKRGAEWFLTGEYD